MPRGDTNGKQSGELSDELFVYSQGRRWGLLGEEAVVRGRVGYFVHKQGSSAAQSSEESESLGPFAGH